MIYAGRFLESWLYLFLYFQRSKIYLNILNNIFFVFTALDLVWCDYTVKNFKDHISILHFFLPWYLLH